MRARIYSPPKNPMQSGRGKIGRWKIEFETSKEKSKEPLMGWTSSSDTRIQLDLSFPNKEAAVEYAQSQGFEFWIDEPKEQKRAIRAYGDNFSYYRREPWSH